MKVGLDLDNTIICYDASLRHLAMELYGMPSSVATGKNAVRQFFRTAGREAEWTALQGMVYGEEMVRAEAFAGALDFVKSAIQRGHQVKIISHRTKYPISGGQTNLHEAARKWLCGAGFVGPETLAAEDVFFETTKEKKLARIGHEGCEVFLDDLPEILGAPGFPSSVRRWLFAPDKAPAEFPWVVRDWASFAREIL